jgi:hypothetical protein
MRSLPRWGAAVLAAVFVIGGAVAASATIATPASSPFNVPGNPVGNPQSFNIVASPFVTGVDQPFAQECDGVDHNDSAFNVQSDCDPYNVSGRVDVNGGVATFPAGNGNFGFFPNKNDLQNRWHCLAPGETPPADGKPSYTNCQVRVALDPNNVQASDLWLTMTLPTPASMWCGMGAGIPPSPNKNSGLDKISKGLRSTVDPKKPKDTKHKLTGTADNCTGMPTAPKTGTPITSGSVQVQAEMTPGATCSNIVTGTIVKSKVLVKWNAINTKTSKPKKVATDLSTLVSFEQFSSNPVELRAVSAPLSASSVFFAGKHLEFTFVMDQTPPQLDQACNTPAPAGKGIVNLTFTGAASFVAIMP